MLNNFQTKIINSYLVPNQKCNFKNWLQIISCEQITIIIHF